MQKRVKLPQDELPHKNQAIEWWYFNGFLKGKKEYAFMTCLFKADRDKINLPFIKSPFKDVYFSHSVFYNLTDKKITKEVLPIVLTSKDSFKRKELFVNYFFPLRTNLFNYEVSRLQNKLRVKTNFFDLLLSSNKKPLLENQTGFINLKEKSTYYYTYSNLSVSGFVGKDKVSGIAWHDKQWSTKGFTRDSWLWFSIQLPNKTEMVCFDYRGKKLATVSYPDGKQKTFTPEFIPIGKKIPFFSGSEYILEWEIKIPGFILKTKPMMKDCEMNFGFIDYWEGPIEVSVKNSKMKARGFMEYVSDKNTTQNKITNIINKEERKILEDINFYKKKFSDLIIH